MGKCVLAKIQEVVPLIGQGIHYKQLKSTASSEYLWCVQWQCFTCFGLS